jgi:hypothetical protein
MTSRVARVEATYEVPLRRRDIEDKVSTQFIPMLHNDCGHCNTRSNHAAAWVHK